MRKTTVSCSLAATVLLASACAAPLADTTKKTQPRGEIVFYVDDFAYRAAAFSEQEVGVGRMGGPAFSSLKLAPDGTWRGKVATFRPGGNPADYTFKREAVGAAGYPSSLVELKVQGFRITGLGTDVTFTQMEGGFKITGLWMKDNVDLTVTQAAARSQQLQFTSKGGGLYAASSVPPLFVRLSGEAANLDAPLFPQIALAALSIGWGVHPNP